MRRPIDASPASRMQRPAGGSSNDESALRAYLGAAGPLRGWLSHRLDVARLPALVRHHAGSLHGALEPLARAPPTLGAGFQAGAGRAVSRGEEAIWLRTPRVAARADEGA